MAEVLTTFSTKSLPVFSSNQILKADDLNALSEYMDGQNRLTRLLTIGSGIVTGLEASCIPIVGGGNVIRVTAGFGISSDGYLFRLTEDCDFDLIRTKPYIPDNAFPCGLGQGSCYTIPWDTSEVDDVWEIEATGQEDGSGFVPLDELLKDGTTLYDFFLDKVLLFLRCQNDEERSPCFNECDQTGMDRTIKVRKYLLRKEDIRNYIGSEGDAQAVDTLKSLCPPPYMHRFGFNSNENKFNLSVISTYTDYQTNYENITSQSIFSIINAYQWAFEAMQIYIDNSPELSLNPNFETGLNGLSNFFNTITNPNQIQIKGIQYFYDYLKDLILAYREFEKAYCEIILKGSFLPNQCNHPGFVSLGGISKVNPDPNSDPDSDPTADCRTNFLASQLGSVSVVELLRKPIFYFYRMAKLTKQEVITNLENTSVEIQNPDSTPVIRITGDRGLNFSLSERALPYYYMDQVELKNCWSDCYKDKSYHIDGQGQISTYNNIPSYYSQANSHAPFNQHLNYDLHHHDFFRIEGHVGKFLEDAITQIENLRKCLNLPFDIKKVRIRTEGEDIITSEEKLNPKYLQLIYENIKCDIISATNSNNPEYDISLSDTLQGYCDNKTVNIEEIHSGVDIIPTVTPPNPNPINPEEAACYIALLEKLCTNLAQSDDPICYFHDYANLHCGLEHAAGVSKGGTFVLVYISDQGGKRVVGDFYLPYYCCGEEQIINIDNTTILPENPPFIFISPCDFCVTDSKGYPILTFPSDAIVRACLTDGQILDDVIVEGKFVPGLVNMDDLVDVNVDSVDIILKFEPDIGVSQTVTVWKKPTIDVTNFDEVITSIDPSIWSVELLVEIPFASQYKWELYKMITDATPNPILNPLLQSSLIDTIPPPGTNLIGFENLESGEYRIQISAQNPACITTKGIDFELLDEAGLRVPPEDDPEDVVILSSSPIKSKTKAKTPKKVDKKEKPKEDILKKEGVAKLIRRRAVIFANVEKMMNTGNLKKGILEEYLTPTFNIPHSDFEKLEDHFEVAKDFVIKEIKNKSAASQKKYFSLLVSMTNYYLDSLVLKSPAKVISNSKKLLTTLVKQLKALKMDVNLISENWKAEELKEKLKAKSIQGYENLFK